MIRVLIADDHAIVRQGLRQILADTPDMEVGGEAANGFEAVQKIRDDGPWDIVLLDVSMPGKNGVDTLKQIKDERPRLPVLVLSMYPEDQYAVRLLKAGAAGYLTKESAPEQLVTAIRTVAAGRRFISPAVAELLAQEINRDGEQPLHAALSDREFEIMRLLASGMSPTDIAEQLKLSVKTVSTYRVRLLAKMQLKNNSELTYYAIKNGLV
jgi:two-component system invasion response regulator UvrY